MDALVVGDNAGANAPSLSTRHHDHDNGEPSYSRCASSGNSFMCSERSTATLGYICSLDSTL